jgi:hypothetical protein
MVVYITQSAFARRWGISRQYVGKLVHRGGLTLSNNGKLDLVFADLFMVKSGTGLLCIQYESQNETDLTQEEIDMIDNDPQLQG